MRKAIVVGLVIGLMAIARGAGAQTPTPTYPPRPPHVCAELSGDVRQNNGRTEVLFQGHITMSGGSGCAGGGEDVVLSGKSQPIFIAQTTALEDGSYRIDATLPPEIDPGAHQLITDFGPGRAQIVKPIRVVSAFVQGTTTAGGSSSGGTLPRTGRDIALLVFWSLALLTVGTLLVVSTYRRFRRVPALAHFGRKSPLMLPEPGVQHVDTARFVPLRQTRAGEAPPPLHNATTQGPSQASVTTEEPTW